jgi:hypothetical protein
MRWARGGSIMIGDARTDGGSIACTIRRSEAAAACVMARGA